MAGFFSKLKERLTGSDDFDVPSEIDEGYVELSTEKEDGSHAKITVRPFILEDFADVKIILDSMREGYTVALVNIRPLKDKDLVELKRAVGKLKKTTEAIDGDIAGFGEDWICLCPSFAQIFREKKKEVRDVRSDEF
ncbi:MAG TPA: cell division protein SepF [Candidatus Nanoarchaeia archaeon]|nr:cell division protein SepF [Candidatus Nanoarchaeia archaeon]